MEEIRRENPVTPVAENLKDVTDGISRLVKEHVELAKIEAKDSFRKVARDSALTAAGAFLLVLGYVLLMFSIGYAIGDRIGLARGFLIVAGVHIVAGAALAGIFASRLKGEDKPSMEHTARELQRDKAFAGRMGRIMKEEQRT
jgi:uncharacterized membrane protein YqjE